ncbi:hypothetical protein FIE12Z_3959 [Fusarium flagelliforme]|uniref:Uncharacterized protein n=1 Tax=Fusarium flagelliforme TaxID=2675880 RepID=A0A395MV07_9HYPO|nr:hypothetical protein FIE12Z_3959 [Fusarium flagelliforme]
MLEDPRAVFLAGRGRHPPNQAVTCIENNVALPGQLLPIYSERANGFVSLDEARLQEEESICGVFKLAIGAADQYTKVEEEVYEALSEIQRIMESARYVDLYRQRREQALQQRTIELFRAILAFLRQIMQFFLDDKSKNFFGSMMKQGT